jgi:ankyrin repeat protein
MLLLAGLGCERRSSHDPIALHQAAKDGDIPRIQSLLAGGADVNEKDGNGRTALIQAISRRQQKAVEVLLDAGAESQFQNLRRRRIPLLVAAYPRLRGKSPFC